MTDHQPIDLDRHRSSGAGRIVANEIAKEVWENEGGHMSSIRGRIMSTPDGEMPYLVILSHENGLETERPFSTLRAAEAFIRRNTPRPQPRNTFWDRPAPPQ